MKVIKRDKYGKFRWTCDGCLQDNYSTQNVCKFEVCGWIVPAPCDRCMDAVERGEKKFENAYTGQRLQRLSPAYLDIETYLEFKHYPRLAEYLETLRPYVGKYLCVGCMPARGMLFYGPGESRPKAGEGFVDQFVDHEQDERTRERLRWIQRQIARYGDKLCQDGATDDEAFAESARILHKIASGRRVYTCGEHLEVVQSKPGFCPAGTCNKRLVEQDPEPLRYESLAERVRRIARGANPSGLILKRNQNSEGVSDVLEDVRFVIEKYSRDHAIVEDMIVTGVQRLIQGNDWGKRRVWEIRQQAKAAIEAASNQSKIAAIEFKAKHIIEAKKKLGQNTAQAELFWADEIKKAKEEIANDVIRIQNYWNTKIAEAEHEGLLDSLNNEAAVGAAWNGYLRIESMFQKYGYPEAWTKNDPKRFPLIGLMYGLKRFIGWDIKYDLYRRDRTVYKCTAHPEVIEVKPGKCPIQTCGQELYPMDPEPLNAGGFITDFFPDTEVVQKELDDNGPPSVAPTHGSGYTDWVIEKDPVTGRDIRFWNRPEYDDFTLAYLEHDMPEDPEERKKAERFHRRMYFDKETGKYIEKWYEPIQIPTKNVGRAPINEAQETPCDLCKRSVKHITVCASDATITVGKETLKKTYFLCRECFKDPGFAPKHLAKKAEQAASRTIREIFSKLKRKDADTKRLLANLEVLEHLYLDSKAYKGNEAKIKAAIALLKGEDEITLRNRLIEARRQAVEELQASGKFDLVEPVLFLNKKTLEHELSVLVIRKGKESFESVLMRNRTKINVIETTWVGFKAAYLWAYLGEVRRAEWLESAKRQKRTFDHKGLSFPSWVRTNPITKPTEVMKELDQTLPIECDPNLVLYVKEKVGKHVVLDSFDGNLLIHADTLPFKVFWTLIGDNRREEWTRIAKKRKYELNNGGLMKPLKIENHELTRNVEPEEIGEILGFKKGDEKDEKSKFPRFPTEYFQAVTRIWGYESGAMPNSEIRSVCGMVTEDHLGHEDALRDLEEQTLREKTEKELALLGKKPEPPKPEPPKGKLVVVRKYGEDSGILDTKGYGPFVEPKRKTIIAPSVIREEYQDVLRRDERLTKRRMVRASLDTEIHNRRLLISDPKASPEEKESAKKFIELLDQNGYDWYLGFWETLMDDYEFEHAVRNKKD